MSLADQITRITEEIKELESLSSQAKLANVKSLLQNEINRLSARERVLSAEKKKAETNSEQSECGIIPVSDYAWDQSGEHVKFYIELNKLGKIDNSQVSLKMNADNKGFVCIFGKYRFAIASLYASVVEAKSSVKITKSNRLIITLAKEKATNWPSVIPSKSGFDEKPKKDDLGAGEDPQAGLMKLMQKMYNEGDDDMKRTIAKTWYESQQNKGNPQFPEL